MKIHEKYIKRCLQIAKNGLGTTRPNPMVGSVIVYNNTIIGEGFTSPYGGAHAEVNAIASVKDKSLLLKSTIYVTLEPCSHYGKTPPCSDLIIKNNIRQVVIGCVDDNPEVAGKGIAKLKAAGCDVIVGVLEEECKQHHKRFFTFHNKKRPYVILKWAETQDGFIAPKTKNENKPVWITNQYSRQLVHKWRAEEQAILVGTNTVLHDNPSLTIRDWIGENPMRIVLDRTLKLSHQHNVFRENANLIIVSQKKESLTSLQRRYLDYVIPNLESIDWNLKNTTGSQICDVLYQNNINSVIIEGGAKTLQTFIDEDLWDEARVFYGNIEFGDGVKAPNLKGKLTSEHKIKEDDLRIYSNTK